MPFGNVPLEEALTCVGKGWEPLIREIYAQKPEDVVIQQVKEKFGRLRVYASDRKFERDIIGPLESLSATICEWCGKPGTEDYRWYWMLTLCPACKRKRTIANKKKEQERKNKAND